ncbi:hypothetical protein TSUD_295410 [Trifolium subterraneum]|uniref:Uncharacterized protein n=1 Tax=Trifolium subterraneum TaxID=3900 RepID=A0A2Z6N6G5_TRISU|nr:hypothetical protein TSUD_295410 [Trifolium subterraneum]
MFAATAIRESNCERTIQRQPIFGMDEMLTGKGQGKPTLSLRRDISPPSTGTGIRRTNPVSYA